MFENQETSHLSLPPILSIVKWHLKTLTEGWALWLQHTKLQFGILHTMLECPGLSLASNSCLAFHKHTSEHWRRRWGSQLLP